MSKRKNEDGAKMSKPRKPDHDPEPPPSATTSTEPRCEEVVLALTLGELPPNIYISRHLDIQLNSVQAVVLRRLFEGYYQTATRLANGRYVQSPADVIRYVLEQVGEGVLKTEG